ncbi:MAG: hypothetical protein RQ748_08350 [Elusimicrobiales bacterium]|nr:hypothetical protein [Elusimicrobiales bacterium]
MQDGHGGTVHAYEPSDGEIAETAAILRAAAPDTVYARVDAVRRQGHFHLMELEILEPELFFRFRPEAMGRFARAVKKRMIP